MKSNEQTAKRHCEKKLNSEIFGCLRTQHRDRTLDKPKSDIVLYKGRFIDRFKALKPTLLCYITILIL